MKDSTVRDAVKAVRRVAFRESVQRRGGTIPSKKDKDSRRKGRRKNSWKEGF